MLLLARPRLGSQVGVGLVAGDAQVLPFGEVALLAVVLGEVPERDVYL